VVPTNDFLAVGGMTFILWKFYLLFILSVGLEQLPQLKIIEKIER
jgi:heme exporter protein D